jgi:2'-5' RNA ligase
MHGIVSLLAEPYYSKVEQLWRELELDCGLQGIKVTPIPHFSWQVASDYEVDLLRLVLKDIAAATRPFRVRTAGLGMFSGPKPVIFINVVKTDEMLHLHKLVWERTHQCAHDISPLYAPQSWIPHITLAHDDLPWQTMSCAIRKLVFQTFDWDMLVSSISVISQADGLVGEESLHFDFSASDTPGAG